MLRGHLNHFLFSLGPQWLSNPSLLVHSHYYCLSSDPLPAPQHFLAGPLFMLLSWSLGLIFCPRTIRMIIIKWFDSSDFPVSYPLIACRIQLILLNMVYKTLHVLPLPSAYQSLDTPYVPTPPNHHGWYNLQVLVWNTVRLSTAFQFILQKSTQWSLHTIVPDQPRQG